MSNYLPLETHYLIKLFLFQQKNARSKLQANTYNAKSTSNTEESREITKLLHK